MAKGPRKEIVFCVTLDIGLVRKGKHQQLARVPRAQRAQEGIVFSFNVSRIATKSLSHVQLGPLALKVKIAQANTL